MKNTKFSVAMSVYKNDDPQQFDQALESILVKQTVKPDEVVLVVDGPVYNETVEVIEKYKAIFPGLHPIYLLENKGLGNALRVAVENAQNELIARMDADDISEETRFEQELAVFQLYPDTDIAGGDIEDFIDDPSHSVGRRVAPRTNEEIYEYMKRRCAMNHVTVLFKKSSVQKAGGYLDWPYNEDYYLWIRMCLKKMVFRNTGTVLVYTRSGEDQYQRRGGKQYYESEKRLQQYMLENKFITRATYEMNVAKRFAVQRVMPNRVRALTYKLFAREK